MTLTPVDHPWTAARAALEAEGVDPRDVRERGITEHGYWNRAGEWTEWPNETAGARVLDGIATDLARRA